MISRIGAAATFAMPLSFYDPCTVPHREADITPIVSCDHVRVLCAA